MKFLCSNCFYEKVIPPDAEAEYAGKNVRCPKCNLQSRVDPDSGSPPLEPPSIAEAPKANKCFVVFSKNGDRKVLVGATDATNAVVTASATYHMTVGDVLEVDCNITEDEFNKIESSTTADANQTDGFFAENGQDKKLIIAGIAVFAFFAFVYDIGVDGVANLQMLQNRNIGCAVGIVLAAVGAVRIAISNKGGPNTG